MQYKQFLNHFCKERLRTIMTSIIDQYFCLIVDRLESSLFGRTDQTQEQTLLQQPSITARTNPVHYEFLNQLQLQTFFGLLFNIFLFVILFVYIPKNHSMCWACSPPITVWIGTMSFLSTIVIIPKIIILRKLFRIEEEPDRSQANFYLLTFFRSKAYKFNSKMDKAILVTYLIGVLLFNWAKISSKGCEDLLGLVAFLLICFLLTIVLSFWKILDTVSSSLRFENLQCLIKRSLKGSFQSLETMKYKEYQRKFTVRDDKMCSICYEVYNDESLLRITKCSGAHAYHKECIDKWLQKSERCPQCNLSAMKKNDEDHSQVQTINQEYMA